MTATASGAKRISALRWLKSTPRRTFVLYPVLVVLFEWSLHGGSIHLRLWGLVFLAWGYLQYRLCGKYRIALGGGGPGVEIPPDRIVASGPYRFLRNPMYLGHLIFMAGLAVTFSSWLALALLAVHMVWFHTRLLRDEARLESRFGAPYLAYKAQVSRWIPGLL